MIHREATIKYKGYDPDKLAPKSNKRVCCICDECGRVRWTKKNNYHDLCRFCARIGKTPMLGKTHSKETRQKISQAHIGKIYKPHTEETKQKISQAHVGKILSKQTKQKISENHAHISGKDHYNYGKNLSDEIKIKMSIAHSGENNSMFGVHRFGKDAPNYKGGTSKTPYCKYFNEPIKEAHRRYFDYKCFIDNESEENGRALSDHHVGYDKRCGCDATHFCIFVPVKGKWNIKFNGSKEYNRWYWYSFLMNKIFIEHPNYFTYHIPVWGMSELEYNYSYVFEKFRRR